MTQALQLIVGLGNPGPEYEDTRHNAGALFVEALARHAGQSLRPEKKYHGLYARIRWQQLDLHLLNPTTFMNRSGLAVKALADFFRIPVDAILVAHDELDLPSGTAKLKQGGGHGGHNGLRDIIQQFGGQNQFHRLRLGIDHPGHAERVVGHVLGRFGKAERDALDAVIEQVCRVLPDAARGQWPRAMNALHAFRASAR